MNVIKKHYENLFKSTYFKNKIQVNDRDNGKRVYVCVSIISKLNTIRSWELMCKYNFGLC